MSGGCNRSWAICSTTSPPGAGFDHLFDDGETFRIGTPRLFLPSLQVNMLAGELPPPESNDRRYFKIPIEASIL